MPTKIPAGSSRDRHQAKENRRGGGWRGVGVVFAGRRGA